MERVKKGPLLFLILIFLSVLSSCRVSKPLITSSSASSNASEYISLYKDLAVSEMRRTGVPASITLAQGMLESDYGRSTLARLGNNHFGIKCHSDWTGQTIRQHDDRRNECFRKYRRPEDSFYDHSDFLRSGSRYRFLFDLDPDDYKAWARGLRKAGYATNPDYANLLIRKIEENKLYDFDGVHFASSEKPREKPQDAAPPVRSDSVTVNFGDKMKEVEPASSRKSTSAGNTGTQQGVITLGSVMARTPRIMENNRVQYIIVKDGDSREKLENEFQLLKWELARYNDLEDNFKPVTGQILYLEPKREKAETGVSVHTASTGDTMHSISQKYAVRLRSLLEMNNMVKGDEPVPGQKILLQPPPK
jgi:LysM repeat protein